MRAVFITESGAGLAHVRYGDRPQPPVRDRQVLIRVRAAGVNPRDRQLAEGTYAFGRLAGRPPTVLGSDVAGEVAARGRKVTDLDVGDEVLAMQTSFGRMGAFAEYVAVDARVVARKPPSVGHVEAASLPVAGLTAWQALVHGAGDLAGARVVVVGAAGGVGHLAVQLARHRGATVTAVCGPHNVATVRRLGAEHVVDHTRERLVDAVTEPQDIVFDAVGTGSLGTYRRILSRRGRYLTTVPTLGAAREWATSALARPFSGGPRARLVLVLPDAGQLAELARLAADGAVRPMIQHTYALQDAPEALREIGGGHVRGKLVLTTD